MLHDGMAEHQVPGSEIDVLRALLEQTERAAAEREELFRVLFENSPIGIGIARLTGELLAHNEAMRAPGGWSVEDIEQIGNVANLYAVPEERDRVLRTMQERGRVDRASVKFRRKDGTAYDAIMSLRFVFYRGERCVQSIVEDVTERRLLEEQLLQAQKMEAVGRLAGGVAHDFNNLLTAILGSISLLESSNERADELHRTIRTAAERGAELTTKLLGFARGAPFEAKHVDLGAVAEETISLLKSLFDPRTTITIVARDTPPVLGDAAQLSQIVMNLCLNARDAMPEGGELRVELGTATLDAVPAGADPELIGRPLVRLDVTDTGPGVPEHLRSKIFEPFFSTKRDHGTGLGLATAFGITRQHGGFITCNNTERRGASFSVFLPATERPADSGERAVAPPAMPNGSEKRIILFVDDEQAIRWLGRNVLEGRGFEVVLAEDGVECIEAFEKRGSFDLVVLDLSMPRMSGQQAFEALRAIDPGVRVLLSTGYSVDRLDDALAKGALGPLLKPYAPADLLLAVYAALEGRDPR
jgi:PAS domain S-box-containing protein